MINQNMSLEGLLTPEQLCDLFHVDKSWIYRQVRERAIPFVKLGKYLRFSRPAIEKWLIENQVNR